MVYNGDERWWKQWLFDGFMETNSCYKSRWMNGVRGEVSGKKTGDMQQSGQSPFQCVCVYIYIYIYINL